MRHCCALAVLCIVCTISAVSAETGHFQEVNGTVSIEAEETISIGGGAYVDTEPPESAPAPKSGGAIFIPCSARRSAEAKWKVTFSKTGTYQVWILGWGTGNAGNNFGVFLGVNPGALRPMNNKQNCSYTVGSSCPNYEAAVTTGSMGWSKNQQCIASRGCTGNVTTWTISEPGTYEMGIHVGDEPFGSHEHGCNDANNNPPVPAPLIIVDKIVINGGSQPLGTGPEATRIGAQASFTYTGGGAAPATVSFDASGSSTSSGSITSYTWDFGDGSTGTGETVEHTFTENKSYTVKLTITTSGGQTGGTSRTVRIMDPSDFCLSINAGGSATGDFSADQAWDGQFGYEGGEAVGSQGQTVGDTDLDAVFSSVRHESFAYKIAVPAATTYAVELLFAEFWRDPGQRVFTVDVEGTLTNEIDIAAAVGNGKALTVNETVEVSDGVLDIQFASVKDNPMVSGIVVTASDGGSSVGIGSAAAVKPATPVRFTNDGKTLRAKGLLGGDVVRVGTVHGRQLARVRAGSAQLRIPMPRMSAHMVLVSVIRNGHLINRSMVTAPGLSR